MRRVLRFTGWALGGLLVLIVVAFVVAYLITEFRIRRTYEFETASIVIPTDAASIEYGRHLGTTWAACTLCHGDDLEGQAFEGPEGTFAPPNLTSGVGGVVDLYTDDDWVRAIRHDVKPSGRSNLFMIGTLSRLSNEELGAIIAWARSVPPVDNVVPASSLSLMGRLFLLLEPGFVVPASDIDHRALPMAAPEPGPTAEYGEHIARAICALCHLDTFEGGLEIEATGGEYKLSRNLTPAGNLAAWTEDEFIVAITSGDTPSGYQLDSEAMPWDIFSGLTEQELHALWLFLQTLPAVESDG